MRSSPRAFLDSFARDVRGASAVEYGILLALLAAMVIGGLAATGTNIDAKLKFLSSTLASAPPN